MLRLGLNPYGLTYTLGLQGRGVGDIGDGPTAVAEFVRIGRAIGAQCLEFDWRWLLPMSDAELATLGATCRADGMTVLCSGWAVGSRGRGQTPVVRGQTPSSTPADGAPLDDVLRVAAAIGASLVRLHLTPVLAGDRAAMGPQWGEAVAHGRATLLDAAPKAAAAGLRLAIENHQDLGSEELLALAEEAGPHVGIVLDTGNPFAVGEDPVAFTERAASRVTHVHLKDYQAQFTDEGVRLVRCAIGEGCVPLVEIAAVLDRAGRGGLTASLEPGALEARHIRLFTAGWWQGYPPRDARELGVAIGRMRRRCLAEDADGRTPWERQAPDADIVAYEHEHLRRSVAHMRALGWMSEPHL